MCGGSDKNNVDVSSKVPDPSTYTYTPMSPKDMYLQWKATGQVPYSYYGAGAPSSPSEYNAHRGYYSGSYTPVTTTQNQQTSGTISEMGNPIYTMLKNKGGIVTDMMNNLDAQGVQENPLRKLFNAVGQLK